MTDDTSQPPLSANDNSKKLTANQDQNYSADAQVTSQEASASINPISSIATPSAADVQANDAVDDGDLEGGNGIAVMPESEVIITSEGPDIVIAEVSSPEVDSEQLQSEPLSDPLLNPASLKTEVIHEAVTDLAYSDSFSDSSSSHNISSDNIGNNAELVEAVSGKVNNETAINETANSSHNDNATDIKINNKAIEAEIDNSVSNHETHSTTEIKTTPPNNPLTDDSNTSSDALIKANVIDASEGDIHELSEEADEEARIAAAQAKEEDEAQKEREAKLESYKQFVAHQESNREIDYPQVRVSIEANALPSKTYFLMNALSAIIASYGLIANSAAVVIGAMLVAMMLGPITGVALAIIDYRMPLLRKSLFTVAAGGLLVVGIGFLVGLLHHGQPLTNEILSRTQPTSMDLMIALAGGTAGAYAMISPHLSVAVVGVAVATALVPPLAASGILFANGEISLGLGAFLLAVTNIIAIQFTNAMVLWFTGFRRLVDDDYKSGTYLTFFRRNAVTLLMLVGLGIYLSINLNTIAKQQKFETDVKAAINDHFIDKGNVLTNTQFEKHDGYQTIRAVVRGERDPSPYDVQQIEAVITQNIEKNYPNYLPVKLQLRYLPIQVIESNPLTKDKLDETDAAILTN
ncbi:MAG: DUF389 domain-containing protein [Psychrobacter sp.]|nr:DUF389 domain-containing protein [Psychrobacter sp.]